MDSPISYRPRLTPEEHSVIQEIRKNKKEHDALKEECRKSGIPYEDVNYYWFKSEKFSINVKNNVVDISSVIEDILSDMRNYSPKYKSIDYNNYSDSHLLVIDPSDIHINKLAREIETGDEYNHEIAIKRVLDGVNSLILKSKSFCIDKILFVIGNDILHVDNTKNTTTGGTQQDVSIMWYDAFKLAQKLLTDCIEMLIQIAPVHVQYDPSNHDYTSGFFLAQTIEAWFNKCDNVTFNISPAHRKYFRYGNNIIGTTHGDGAKESDLPLLMAHESIDWSSCRHKYIYTHHIHHKKSKDYMGVTIESMRSPSGADSWHSKSGYLHAPKAIECFMHHPEYGQVARFSHIFQ